MRTRAASMTIAGIAAVAIGVAGGIGGYTFVYAKGASYLTNDPTACANCHVMREHLEAWEKSSHRHVAVCNDCHTPHNLIGKYAVKASNGFWHSFAFTSGKFPDPLRIKAGNRTVAEDQCRRCHASIVAAMDGPHGRAGRSECIHCHRDAGHMR